jgi:hypothetical protein
VLHPPAQLQQQGWGQQQRLQRGQQPRLWQPYVCQQRHQHGAQRQLTCHASAASGGDAASAPGPHPLGAALAAAAAFVQAQFLPVVLVTAICVGCSFPQAGVAVSQLPNLTAFVTTAMFVISGLQLRQGEALQALKARGEQLQQPEARLYLSQCTCCN